MPTALPLLAMAFASGIWLGDLLHIGLRAASCGLLFAAVLLFAALWRDRLRGCALLLGTCALGVLAQSHRPPTIDAVQVPEGADLDLSAPQRWEGELLAMPLGTADGLALRVAVSRVAMYRLSPPLLLAVSLRGAPQEPLWPGDRLRLRARLRPPGGLHNPGAADGERRAAADGIQAVASVPAEDLVRLLPEGRERAARRALARLRARLLAVLRAHLADPDRPLPHALVAALALGDRGALARVDAARRDAGAPPIEEAFRAAGISHILSVSGLHLAVVAFLFYAGLAAALLRVPPLCRRFAVRRLAAACAIPATLTYTLLTGAEVATCRAAGVATLWFLAVACGRRARLPEALAGCLLFLLLRAPLLLFDPALQLSVAAVVGIAALRPLHLLLGPHLTPEAGAFRADPIAAAARRLLRFTDASLGAALATAPLCAVHFSQVQIAGLIGNLLAVPLGEVAVVPLGIAGCALGLLWPAAAAPPLALAGWAASLLADLATQLAELSSSLGAAPVVPAPPWPCLALFTLGLLALARRRRSWPVPCLGAVLLQAVLVLHPPSSLRATFLDVGQGDATVLELPGGGVIVVDAGGLGEHAPDPGERVVVPFLQRRGHRHIDLLVASHPHPDHVGGLAAVLERLPVRRLWAVPPGAAESIDPAWARVLATARRLHVPVAAPAPIELHGVRIEPLAPCPPEDPACPVRPHAGLGHNNNSLVLRVRFAGRSLLLPGDIELPGELLLLDRDRHDPAFDPRADVLKAPHHCSGTSSSESLLAAVRPAWIICSLGLRNRYGFPHPEVTARYQAIGARLLRTDRDGAIRVEIRPDGRIAVTPTRAAP
jgi:competence protein ComEC